MRPWNEYVQVILSLFAMCTAPALIPMFLGMTSDMTEKERKKTAWGVAATVMVSLTVMIFFGEPLFKLMGIDIDAFRVGGGILIFLASLSMINSAPEMEQKNDNKVEKNNPAVVPLGIPIVAGPGLLSTMLIQSSKTSGLTDDLIMLASAATISLYVLISFLAGEKLVQFLGQSGLSVITKISGLLLTAIAVDFVADGLKALFPVLKG